MKIAFEHSNFPMHFRPPSAKFMKSWLLKGSYSQLLNSTVIFTFSDPIGTYDNVPSPAKGAVGHFLWMILDRKENTLNHACYLVEPC